VAWEAFSSRYALQKPPPETASSKGLIGYPTG